MIQPDALARRPRRSRHRRRKAARRLARDGPNRLVTARPIAAWRELAGELTRFFAAMLWVASGR